MKVCGYISDEYMHLAHMFPKFNHVGNIRETSLDYDIVIILDESINDIVSLTTLIDFHKSLKDSTFIFIYEKRDLEVYTSLFDKSFCIPIKSIEETTINSIIVDNLSDEVLSITKDSSGYKEEELEIELPSVLPQEPSKLVNIINELSSKLITSNARILTSIKEIEKLKTNRIKLLTSLNKERILNRKMSILVNEMVKRNNELERFKDTFLIKLREEEDIEINFDLTDYNKNNINIIHIKELDELMFTRTFLKILKRKIERLLGLPTKVLVLEEVNRKINYYDDYHKVYGKYDDSIFGSDFVIKKGHSERFLIDILNDRSKPRVLIIYNTIHSLMLEEEFMINYYSTRGAPSRNNITNTLEQYTITNYPNQTVSFPIDPNYDYFRSIQLSPYHLIESDVFNNIVKDLETVISTKRDSMIRREIDEISKIE